MEESNVATITHNSQPNFNQAQFSSLMYPKLAQKYIHPTMQPNIAHCVASLKTDRTLLDTSMRTQLLKSKDIILYSLSHSPHSRCLN